MTRIIHAGQVYEFDKALTAKANVDCAGSYADTYGTTYVLYLLNGHIGPVIEVEVTLPTIADDAYHILWTDDYEPVSSIVLDTYLSAIKEWHNDITRIAI